jgi:3-oxoacyl-[acyl-carrier-protein] synthase-1
MASLWQQFFGSPTQPPAVPSPVKSRPLTIRSAGLCCSVGYHLAAASTAIRARVDHFQHGHFKTLRGEKLVVSQLPERRLWGAPRLARWLEWALRDCLRDQVLLELLDESQVAVVWLAPIPREAGLTAEAFEGIYTLASEALGVQFHASSGVVPLGRAGLAHALQKCDELLQKDGVQAVVLAGVDSLLDAAPLNELLHQERLLVPGNSDGFIPGEAAAAVLLQRTRESNAGEASLTPTVQVLGYGHAQEAGRVDGSVPSRAQGLTQALRAAMTTASVGYNDLEFRCSDQSGEAFYSREAAHALSRIAPTGGENLTLLTLADCIGEVGAASGPAMLAHLFHQMPHALGPGPCGVLHLAGDDGLRSAAVLRVTST